MTSRLRTAPRTMYLKAPPIVVGRSCPGVGARQRGLPPWQLHGRVRWREHPGCATDPSPMHPFPWSSTT